jgi:hypothetical protein
MTDKKPYRFKAYNASDVVDYIIKDWFKPEFQDTLETDWQDENNAFIIWSNCDKDDCAEANNVEVDSEEQTDMCQFCDVGQSSFEVSEIEQPDSEDYKFNTIEGTNNIIDLTQDQPKQAEDWNKQLADTWKADPQAGANMLLIKSLIAMPKMLVGHEDKTDIFQIIANGQKLYYHGDATKEQFENPNYWSLNKYVTN